MAVLFLFTDNASEVAITAPGTSHHRNSSTGPTPDCSPPSPDTALKNIVKVIRPQVSKYPGGHCLLCNAWLLGSELIRVKHCTSMLGLLCNIE